MLTGKNYLNTEKKKERQQIEVHHNLQPKFAKIAGNNRKKLGYSPDK